MARRGECTAITSCSTSSLRKTTTVSSLGSRSKCPERLHARGTYDEWIDEDPEGRDPHELLTLLLQAGAQVDPNMIRLDDDRMFLFDVSAQALCKYLKWFCTAGPYKQSGNKGGMTSADGKYIFQFGKRSDGGLLDLLHAPRGSYLYHLANECSN